MPRGDLRDAEAQTDDEARYASGVVLDRATALAWIERQALTRVLTQYAVRDG